MLRKLIKYEIKVTSRTFLPLYAGLIVFSLINKFFFALDFQNKWMNLPKIIFMATYVLLIIATIAFTLILIIQRYYKNLLRDEGYLMNTIPVTASQNILSKMFTSMMWSFSSAIVTTLSIFILVVNKEILSCAPEYIRYVIDFFHRECPGVNSYIYILEMILMLFVSAAGSILMIYAAISIGQLLSKHRLLASFGAFLVLSAITQFITTIIVMILTTIDTPAFISRFNPQTLAHMALLGMLVLNAVFAAGYFYISNHILTKRLNLE